MVHPSVSASSLARNDERLASGYYIFRAIGALLGLAAILAQLTQSISNALASTTPYGSDVAVVAVNFFSFFTIQSNVLAVAVLAYGAIWGLARGKNATVEPRVYATVLAATTTYMVLTGIVYNILLRGIALPQGTTVVGKRGAARRHSARDADRPALRTQTTGPALEDGVGHHRLSHRVDHLHARARKLRDRPRHR